jgi:hypothetical protein
LQIARENPGGLRAKPDLARQSAPGLLSSAKKLISRAILLVRNERIENE